MMRQLKEADRQAILNYLYQEQNYNIFAIGDIEHFGFNQSFQHVYATFDDANQITSMFLCYRKNGIFYTSSDQPFEPYKHLIEEHNLQFFSLKTDLADSVRGYLEGWKQSVMYFCAYSHTTPVESIESTEDVVLLHSDDDFGALYEMMIQIDEFGIKREQKEEYIEGKQKSVQMGKTLAIWDNAIIVSTAATTAETTKNAMVVGVATLPQYRNKGYASMLMIALQRYYKSMEKDLCLFFDNPKAGSIYHRIGFKDTGMWTMFKRSTS